MLESEQIIDIFRAFSDMNRVKILHALLSGEKCGMELLDELNITQSTLSHHIKLLLKAKVVTFRRDGTWMYYSLNADGLQTAMSYLNELQDVALHIDESYKATSKRKNVQKKIVMHRIVEPDRAERLASIFK